MSYDRFEEDWNGIAAAEVERNNPSGNLFGGNQNRIPPPPAPKDTMPAQSRKIADYSTMSDEELLAERDKFRGDYVS